MVNLSEEQRRNLLGSGVPAMRHLLAYVDHLHEEIEALKRERKSKKKKELSA